MSEPFVGRRRDLGRLQRHLDAIERGHGRLVAVRGRRQVGKSRLVSEFVAQSGLPSVFVTATRQVTVGDDLALLAAEIADRSTLPERELFAGGAPSTWDGALRQLAAILPNDRSSIVVLDEFPWFLERDAGLEGVLQALWDRVFEARPVLMILVGSDLAVMEALSTHDRPLYGRTHELTVRPFDPADTAAMASSGVASAEAIDLHLVTGGFPRLVRDASMFASAGEYVTAQLADEDSSFCANALRALAAELPPTAQAARVLRAIGGAGERTFTNIAKACRLGHPQVERALSLLATKGIIERDLPLSVPPGDHPRYRVADSYLRCWLALVEPALADIARGRPDLARDRFHRGWPAWRGRAIEPLVREAVARLAPSIPAIASTAQVSGWWPRNNVPEVDLVGVDRAGAPTTLTFAGSIKWREDAPFTSADRSELERSMAAVPGASTATPRLAVARTAVAASDMIPLTATDLITAWAVAG